MAEFRRRGEAVWLGDLKAGNGRISTRSGALKDVPYSFSTRFQDEPGTNPEELIAAAHAACYSMALADTLASKGWPVERIETSATCTVASQPSGGFRITAMRLVTRARVPGLDEAGFAQLAQAAEKACPVSNVLRSGLRIELEAALI